MFRPSVFALPAMAALLSGCILSFGDDEDGGEGPHGKADDSIQDAGCVPSGHVDTHAVCLCGDLNDVGAIDVLRGPGGEATLAVNGRSNIVSSAYVDGTFLAHGGLAAVASARIEGDLVTAHDVSSVGELQIGKNLVAGGHVDAVGDLEVGGSLMVKESISVLGEQRIGSFGEYPGTPPVPCGCDGASFFDVARAVEDARTVNDNAGAGLDDLGLPTVGSANIALASGRYYFGDIQTVGSLRIEVRGHVAVFVDGSIDTVGATMFEIAAGASLDLYVSGSVATVGSLVAGAEDRRFRLLVGGDDALLVSVGSQVFYGHIYAPTASIDFVGDTRIVGSLFANDLNGVGTLRVEYGGSAPTDPVTCIPPEGGRGGSGATPGDGGDGCGGDDSAQTGGNHAGAGGGTGGTDAYVR